MPQGILTTARTSAEGILVPRASGLAKARLPSLPQELFVASAGWRGTGIVEELPRIGIILVNGVGGI